MVANSKQRYDENASGVFITYICNFAHHFPDRSTVKQIQCLLGEGNWSNSLPDCEGKSWLVHCQTDTEYHGRGEVKWQSHLV